MDLRFRVVGEEPIVERFLGLAAAAEDLRPAWGSIARRFIAAEEMTFASEGGDRGRWKPLSETYGAWKAEHYPGQPILQRDGDLMRSLTSDPLDIDVREAHMMVLGTSVPYASYHQTGTSTMPARPPIDLGQEEMDAWVTIVRDHLLGLAAGEVAV